MNSSEAAERIEWVSYCFEPFGLHCDIFAGVDVAIMIDPRTPLVGYLAQTRGPLTLMIKYGPDAGLGDHARRIMSLQGRRVGIHEESRPATLCARPAERIVLQVEPEEPARGVRFTDGLIEELRGWDTEPYLMVMIGAAHRETPLVATFRKPLAEAQRYETAESHFFASFRCEL
jgi:hypothetical protein